MGTHTWLEVEELLKVERERRACLTERKAIIASFKQLRREVRSLLIGNLEGPENEKLDIQEFNLDEEFKERVAFRNQIECDNAKKYYEQVIIAQNKVTQWIKRTCWDPISIQRKSILAFFASMDVENYPLFPLSDKEINYFEKVEEARLIELLLSYEDSFKPWRPLRRG